MANQNQNYNSTFIKEIKILIWTMYAESKLQFHVYKGNRNFYLWNRNFDSTFKSETAINSVEVEL